MSKTIHVISVSGGKDSTAMILLALEFVRKRGIKVIFVFADTGNEHPAVYEYLDYLEQTLGITIQRLKADFTADIARKRQFVKDNWFDDLVAGKRGRWEPKDSGDDIDLQSMPATPHPKNLFRSHHIGMWRWRPAIRPWTAEDARQKVAAALEVLHPTGNPFLDLCLWKGRFPSRRAQFCTEELKAKVIEDLFLRIRKSGFKKIVSWQGIRSEESRKRAADPRFEKQALCYAWRPIKHWTVEDVFAMHSKHGVKPNPLYLQGMSRVGCMPCINCKKSELREISRRFPEHIARIAEWEQTVSHACKRDKSSFFTDREKDGQSILKIPNIHKAVEWSKTTGGAWNFDLVEQAEPVAACSSAYGLCDAEGQDLSGYLEAAE